jgi:3-hydroxyacyl-CoA dehydrogenase
MNRLMSFTLPLVRDVRRVTIVGAGSVGRSWAALYLAHAYDVIVFDPAPECEQGTREFILNAWVALRQLHSSIDPSPPWERLTFVPSIALAIGDTDVIQENAPEDVELKRQLIAEIDQVTPRNRVILSSSGGIGPSALQGDCRFPERVVVAHPFNPPHLIPLVEIVGGSRTDPAAVRWAQDFMRQLGKRPIILRREVRGHLANRLQAALVREAFHCLVSEVASAQDIDDALRYGLGLRWALMGALMTFHLAGGAGGAQHTLDLAGEAYESWWADLGTIHLTADVRARIVAATADMAAGRSIADWISWRDEHLVALLRQSGATECRV